MPFPRLVFPRFVAALATLAFVSPLTLTAAETPITTPAPAPAPIATPATNPATTPPAPTAEIQAVAADLLKALPQVACLVERDGNALWTGSKDLSFKVASLDKNGNPLVETAIGRLAIDRRLLADNRSDAADALPRLIEHAKAANLTGDGFMLREGVLTGLHLFSSQVRVLDEGVVRKVEVPTDERNADRERVIAASELLIKAMARTDLDDLGKKTLEDVLHRTAQEDGNQEVDEVFPSFARRVIRAGWLRQFFAKDDAAAVANLEQLVTKAEQFQPVTLFTGPGLKLAEVRDAFNRGGRWLLSTPSRAAYVQPHESPLYYWAMSEPGPTLVVDLPGGADPAVPNDGPVGARIYQDQQLLVSWSKDKGLVANKDEWRKAIPARGRKGIEPNAVTDFMPPHILITALNGDIMRLVTVTGQLVPPKNGSTQEVERFLAESAKALPDPAHLDLIGEYIFAYVYDSPDSRYPYLIGNKGVKGDIHQTAAQTIATATGGMIRGDCDDLSELYQTIAERQGRTAHVVSLPQHAAMAFAEKKEDGNWHSYVLQTGPPLEFIDAKLPLALEKAYKHFNENDAFDPNGLGLLLRFSGENTRGQWRLSWRIFSEPEYAKTMIDVQRDWHFQTYQRGIAKMKKLIADGDNDNANFRELSGLFGFTGQYGLAVEYHDEAIKRTPDPEGRLGLSIELVQHLFDAKQTERARETALDILDKQLPTLKRNAELKAKMEATQAGIGLELASALCHGKAFDLALRALKDTQLDDMVAKIEQVGQWLASTRFNQKAWENSPQLTAMRHQLEMYTAVAVEVIAGMPAGTLPKDDDLQKLARSVQDWLTAIAFHDVDEPEDVLSRYSVAGRYYAAMLGETQFASLLDAVALPKNAEYDHAKRIGGLAQLQLDLPWIKLSVPYWAGRLTELFDKEKPTLDKALVARLGKQVQDSYAASTKLGLEHPLFDRDLHLSALITALVGQDAKVLHERLAFVKAKDDKRLRDDTAQWLGDPARFLPLDWYQQVMQIWKDELNYQPKYYWIAWRAALNGAPKHALLVASMAAKEFSKDASFTEEYEFMKKLFGEPAAPIAAPAQPAPPAPNAAKPAPPAVGK